MNHLATDVWHILPRLVDFGVKAGKYISYMLHASTMGHIFSLINSYKSPKRWQDTWVFFSYQGDLQHLQEV